MWPEVRDRFADGMRYKDSLLGALHTEGKVAANKGSVLPLLSVPSCLLLPAFQRLIPSSQPPATTCAFSHRAPSFRPFLISSFQTLVDGVLRRILIEQDLEGAKNMVKQTVSDLLQNKVDLSELVISKSLGKGASSEDYAAKLAHVELAERMRKRDPKSAPAIGDRVAYVMIKGLKGAAGYEKAEDPLYVLQHNLAIDAQHYIDHQLKQPLQRIFEPIMNKPDALFGGDHTKKVAVLTSKTGALAKFVTKQLTCLGCKVPLKDGGALCPHCRDGKQQQIVRQRLAALREHERTYRSLWVECQRCQGSLHQDILCQSRDCPIFYRRTKAKNDIENVQEAMDRLRLEW